MILLCIPKKVPRFRSEKQPKYCITFSRLSAVVGYSAGSSLSQSAVSSAVSLVGNGAVLVDHFLLPVGGLIGGLVGGLVCGLVGVLSRVM
jgi:hypothetical protein